MQPEKDLNLRHSPTVETVHPARNLPNSGNEKPSVPARHHGADFKPPPAPPRRRGNFSRWRSILSTLFLFLAAPAIALLIAAFVVQSYQVDGQSMEPTLQDNDRLIVDKWQRSWARITNHDYVPKRGEIIIFNQGGLDFAGGTSKQLIKRVIGLPNERVVVEGGKITIYNNERPDGFNPDTSLGYSVAAAVTPGNVDVTLAGDEVFVCGDNRANSEDSRYFGPIKASQIVGKLAFRLVPLDKAQKF